MNSIQQSVTIPANRRLQLDLALPDGIPVGQAEMLVVFFPATKTVTEESPKAHTPSPGTKRLGCMRGFGFVDNHTDSKAIGREEIISMFEGRE